MTKYFHESPLYFVQARELLFRISMQMDSQDRNKTSRERIEQYRRLIALSPKDVQLYFELGLLFKSLGRTREALQEWKKSIQIDPNNLRARREIQDLLNDSDSTRDRCMRP